VKIELKTSNVNALGYACTGCLWNKLNLNNYTTNRDFIKNLFNTKNSLQLQKQCFHNICFLRSNHMSRIHQNFLLFVYLINISLLIVFISNLAGSNYDWQGLEEEETTFVDITDQDYIDKHVNEKSRKIIQECKERCILLQQKGDFDALLNEMGYLSSRAFKKISKNKLTKKICLAIVKKIYFDPATAILHDIIHAPIEEAYNYLGNLKFQIIKQATEDLATTAVKWCIKKYGFDLLNTARDCYMSRNDTIDITQYQSIFSDNLKHILSIIQHKSLPIAYAELIHLKKQIIEHLESHNITDSVAQKEFIIKNFNCDIVELATNVYRGRLDHKTLVSFFISIDIQNSIIKMLNIPEDTYESRIRFIYDLAKDVFQNGKLSGFDMAKSKSCIYQALNIIEKPCNNTEFISNMTLINNVLSDIKDKVYSIIHAKPILLREHSERFTQAIEKFLAKKN